MSGDGEGGQRNGKMRVQKAGWSGQSLTSMTSLVSIGAEVAFAT